jgi:hypothetical protein
LTRSRSRSPKNERAPGRPAFEPDLVKTFSTRGLADQWASAREGEIAKAEIVDYRAAEKVTLAELCQRYADENFEPKTSDSYRVLAFKRQPFAEKSLSAVQPADIIAWRNQRLKEGFERGGVLKDLQVLSKIIKTARTQWKISLASNPASAEFVPRPTLTEEDERDRTLRCRRASPRLVESASSPCRPGR